MESLVYAYLLLLVGVLPLYMQNGLAEIGNVKYLFFRNTTVVMGAVFLIVWVAAFVKRDKNEKGKSRQAKFFVFKTDIFVWAYLLSCVVSFLISPDRQAALWGASGWYMGLFSQVLFVGIYFVCSRYYDGSKSIWTVTGVVSGIVTLIGVLNRLDIDILGVFRDMERSDWNRAYLLSTIGNNNWYAGYISVTIGAALAAACCGKQIVRILGLIGCFLFFASSMTANALTCVMSACGICVVLLIVSLQKRNCLIRALEVLMLLPLSNLAVQLWTRWGVTGLVLGGEAEGYVFFSPIWSWLLVVELLVYIALRVRKVQAKADWLEQKKVFRFVGRISMAAVGVFAVCGIGFLLFLGQGTIWKGEAAAKLSNFASGRISLWCVTLQTFLKETLPYQVLGNGPDNYYYILHEWGADISAWINSGALPNAIYTNAHNEWLTMLINQGVLGVLAYAGLFVSGQKTVEAEIWDRQEYFAVYFGIAGYFICSLFTFQHVISTPYVFALLGMAAALSKRLDK